MSLSEQFALKMKWKLADQDLGMGMDITIRGVRLGVPNNDQFFNDFGLLIILYNCFFPGWFFKKS